MRSGAFGSLVGSNPTPSAGRAEFGIGTPYLIRRSHALAGPIALLADRSEPLRCGDQCGATVARKANARLSATETPLRPGACRENTRSLEAGRAQTTHQGCSARRRTHSSWRSQVKMPPYSLGGRGGDRDVVGSLRASRPARAPHCARWPNAARSHQGTREVAGSGRQSRTGPMIAPVSETVTSAGTAFQCQCGGAPQPRHAQDFCSEA